MNEIKKNTQRIFYIDNLRIFLTFLVVAHHWAIANGGPGDWYYTESGLGNIGTLIFSMFVATNQAFFMGFFFFISAYFVPSSYKRKGGLIFLKERLVRLGIPLLFYALVISPLLIFSVRKLGQDYTGSFFDFVISEGGRSVGPMWFVALLLIFSIVYWWFNQMFRKYSPIATLPKIKKSYQFAGFVALILFTFIIRIYAPVGKWIPIIGIQPAHLVQYMLCFSLGIWAKQSNAFERLNFKASVRWFALAQVLIFVLFPVLFLLGGSENTELFMGGTTWQSFAFVLWEQLVAISLIFGLLGLFKRYFTHQPKWVKNLSRNSYAIYVVHGIVLVSVSLVFRSFQNYSFQKFVLLVVPAFLFCYLLAKFVRSIPFIQKVL